MPGGESLASAELPEGLTDRTHPSEAFSTCRFKLISPRVRLLLAGMGDSGTSLLIERDARSSTVLLGVLLGTGIVSGPSWSKPGSCGLP